ncbi:MAG: Fe-S-containing hydro-lyase [Bacillota bacterium]|nr:Fe-S-containing hydro-lyase [Bacillota bacterium]
MEYTINTPLTDEVINTLRIGDTVNITGTIYTARDAAHKRMISMLNEGKDLPFDIKNQVIYYVGPCPARPGHVIGSAGPTTSSRMDAYAPKLIELGLKGMIGKGLRNKDVISAMTQYKAVYFGATGGAGALLAKSIINEEVIAFPDLGAEAIRKLQVVKFPTIVIIDCYGNNLYDSGRKLYASNV